MRRQRSAILRLSALTIILGCIGGNWLIAVAEKPPPPEEIILPLGAVFEILAQSAEPGTQYAWTLSLERTFLQAERGRSFRTRFSQPGRYLLSTEVVRPGSVGIRKGFLINVRTDAPSIPVPEISIESDPAPSSDGVIILPEGRSVVRLSASTKNTNAIALDANTATDEDGDGDASNDPSASGTFFATERVPLWIWCTDTLPSSIAITTSGSEGASKQQFLITREGLGTEVQKEEVEQGDIFVEDRGNGVVRLGFDTAGIGVGVVPLALWDFGDGEQSMISNPVHRYSASGSYTVRLQITDLRNGTVTKEITQPISIVIERTENVPVVETVPEKKPTPKKNEGIFAGPMLPLIMRMGGVLVSAVALGAIIMALVTLLRKKRKSLQQHLEDADKRMAIGKEGAKASIVEGTVAPLVLEEAVDMAPESLSTPESPPEEILGPAPSWLNPMPSPVVQSPLDQGTPVNPILSIPVKENLTPIPSPTIIPEPQTQKQVATTDVSTPTTLPSPASVMVPAPTAPPQAPSESAPAAPSPAPVNVSAQSTVTPSPVTASAMSSADGVAKSKSTAETDTANNDNGDLPAWLQPEKVAAPQPAPPPTPTLVEPENNPPIRTQATQIPQPATMQTEKPATSTQTQISDKERERRRLKRQRYRANLRRREEEKSAPVSSPQAPADPAMNNDAPIAIVRAESITQKEEVSPPDPASQTLPSAGASA